jgi:hypothetical protein
MNSKDQVIQEAQEDRQIIGGYRVMGGFTVAQMPNRSYQCYRFDYGQPRLREILSYGGKIVEFWDYHKSEKDWTVGTWEKWPDLLPLAKVKMLLAAAASYRYYQRQELVDHGFTRNYYDLQINECLQVLALYCTQNNSQLEVHFRKWLALDLTQVNATEQLEAIASTLYNNFFNNSSVPTSES